MYIFLSGVLLLAVIVYWLDAIAQDNFYYWIYWWYDIMMHFLGGFLVASFVLWFFLRFGFNRFQTLSAFFVISIVSGFSIGIGWELFEYFSGILQQQPGNIIGDTILDLVMDCVGAIAAWGVASLFFVERKELQNG
jgi:hypothetical protein